MRVLTQPIADDGRRIGTLHDRRPADARCSDAQASLLRTFALVGSLALAARRRGRVVLIATLIARPLRRMAAVAAAVDAGDLSLRAGPVGARGEVGVLAAAFDRMLDRLERAFARQRDFVSDASHELRTPLAVLRAQVELLDRETDERAPPRGHRDAAATAGRDGPPRRRHAHARQRRGRPPGRSHDRSSSTTSSRTCAATCRCSASATSTSSRSTACSRPIPTGSPRCCATSCATPSRTPTRRPHRRRRRSLATATW